jgi:ankyrin repeat protein
MWASFWSAEKNDQNILDFIDAGANVDHFHHCETLLASALRQKREGLAHALLKKGANINIADCLGNFPLKIALNEHLNIYKDLVSDKSVNTWSNDGIHALERAMVSQDFAFVAELISLGAHTGGQSKSQFLGEMLVKASKYDGLEQVAELIALGAGVDTTDDEGNSALGYASWYGKVDIVKALLAAGAKVNTANKNGTTPLHEAKRWNSDPTIADLLIAAGARLDAKDNDGNTPDDLRQAKP